MRYDDVYGKDYNDAYANVKEQYGDEALILSHKHIEEGGLFNSRFFAKKGYMITVGIVESNRTKAKAVAKSPAKATPKVDFTVDDKTPVKIPTTNKGLDNFENAKRQFLDKVGYGDRDPVAIPQRPTTKIDDYVMENDFPEINLVNNMSMDEKRPVQSKPSFDMDYKDATELLEEPRVSGNMSLEREIRDLKRMMSKLIDDKNIEDKGLVDEPFVPYLDLLERNEFGGHALHTKE